MGNRRSSKELLACVRWGSKWPARIKMRYKLVIKVNIMLLHVNMNPLRSSGVAFPIIQDLYGELNSRYATLQSLCRLAFYPLLGN